jgi:uncharacterized OsmC-like protein
MAVDIDVEYLGGLKTRATHGPSGATLVTAAPKDNQGDGSTFSPTDLAATALATCVLTTMAIAARKHGVELDGARAHVSKVMSADPPRRIARLPLTVTMPAGVPRELRERLEVAGRACPVHQSLERGVEQPVEFVWPD